MGKRTMITGYIYVIASAVIFGCMPLMTKLIYAEGANPMSVVALRNAMALPVMALLVCGRGGSLRISMKQLPMLTLIGVLGCCITPWLLFASYDYIFTGTATVLHFVYPALVVVGSAVFLKSKTSCWHIISVAVCITGIALFYTPGQMLRWQGVVLSLSSGLAFAVYVLLLSTFRRGNMTGMTLTFYVVLVSAVSMFALCLITGQMAFPTSLKGWLLCAIFAVTVSVGAVALFQQGTLLIGGQRASILSTIEPITGIVIGVTIFQEDLTWRTVLGSCLVILASILIAISDAKKQKTICPD